MDFAFTDEQRMIVETAQAFFTENATSERTRAAMAGDGMDAQLWTAFCQELGLAGVALSEDAGGVGLGMVELAIIAEAAGAQVSAIPMLGHVMVTQAIAAGGSEAQRERWIGALTSGEAIAAAALDTDVVAAGDTLSGTVRFVPHGALAHVLLIANDKGAWLVEAGAQGVAITAHITMDQTRPMATVTLSQVAAKRLPNPLAAIAAARAGGMIVLSAEALGGAQETLDRTVSYAKDRVQFGRAIGSFQAYKHRLADMMIEIEQARSAVYWAACAVDEGAEEAAMALPSAKSFCADTFFKCAGDMIQLHGGIGFTWEHDAHLFFKRARSIQTLLGHGAQHRETIAKLILGEAA